MHTWGWVLIVAAASVTLFVLLGTIVRRTHRLSDEHVVDAHPADLGAPLPVDVALEADGMTAREFEADRDAARDGVSRVP